MDEGKALEMVIGFVFSVILLACSLILGWLWARISRVSERVDDMQSKVARAVDEERVSAIMNDNYTQIRESITAMDAKLTSLTMALLNNNNQG